MVPTTHESRLANDIRETLKYHKGPIGTEVRVVEQPGPKIMSKLIKGDPFPQDWCGRADCPLYRQEDSCIGKCYKESVTYRAVCTRCDTSVQHSYEGETSRSIYTRYNQHLSDYVKASNNGNNDETSSWMWDHARETHNGQVSFHPYDDYKISLVRSYRHPMDRQIAEAIRIEKSFSGSVPVGKENISCICLNRKYEHFAPIERRDRNMN